MNGYCLGGGLELALQCDIIVALTGSGSKSFCVGADLTAPRSGEVGVAEAFGFDLEFG